MEQSGAGMAVVVGVATNGDSVMMAPSRFCESPSCLVSPQDELTPIVFLLLLEARPTGVAVALFRLLHLSFVALCFFLFCRVFSYSCCSPRRRLSFRC